MRMKFLLLSLGLVSGIFVACSKGTTQAGIEVGNPSVTVSAEFNVVKGLPSYAPLARKALYALTPDQMTWTDLRLPLTQVRYFASYYYYMPTDPNTGAALWPSSGLDSLRPMDVLKGDTLVANFDEMDIPSRSYLKEIVLQFNLSKWTVRGNSCATTSSCQKVELNFPDSTYLELRYHHDQLERVGDTGHVKLPVQFHAQVLLASVNLSGANVIVSPDSVVHVYVDSSLLESFAQSFNALRYSTHKVNSHFTNFVLTPPALVQYDSVGVNRVQNGDFSLHGANWIFLTELGGVADTSFSSDGVNVKITGGGHVDYAVQWMQEDIELIQGRWYQLKFTAKADVDSTLILVRVGRYHAPYDNLDAANQDNLAPLSTVEKEFTFDFCAKETNPFGRLEFNLGNYVRSVTIKNVSLIQQAF